MFSEVFRGFQRFSEVLEVFRGILSELRVVLPLIVLPLKTPTIDSPSPTWAAGNRIYDVSMIVSILLSTLR